MNGDESSKESSSSCCSKRHGLSRVRRIEADFVNRSDVEQLIEMMPFITAPHEIWVEGDPGEVFDAEVTESLLRSIPITHKLELLVLQCINVTSSPAVEFIDSLFKKAPNLEWLNMSFNRLLGAGVDSLIKHLSCAPHLERLNLVDVKMTPQQVMDLSSAIKQHGNNTELWSSYHEQNGDPKPEREWPSENYWKWKVVYPHLSLDSSSESEDDQEQQDDSSAESDDEEEQQDDSSADHDDEEASERNEEEMIGSEDERSSSESEDNQEQDDSSAEHDDEEERDEEGMIESEDGRSSSEPEDNQEQILEETHPSVHGSPFLAHDPDTVGTFPVSPDPAAGSVLAVALSPSVHGSSHGLTSFSGYLPPHVDPQHHSSPDIHTHHDNTPSTTFTPAGSWGSDLYLQDEPLLELSVGEILAEFQLYTRPSTQDAPLHDLSGAVGLVPVPLDPAADPMLTGASITTAHGSVHGLAPVEPFTANPVQIQYPQHYSSPVIQSHHHSTPSTIFTPGRSLGSDSFLVGDPGLSTFPQSEPSLGSLPVDEILEELHWVTRPSTQDVLLQDPGAVGSVPVPLDPAVSAPFSMARDFNHSLAPSIEDPPLHGMPKPSLYEWQTLSTIAGDHCFSGSTSSTVPPLLGTPGYLSSHGMMGQSMHGLQTQSTIPGVTQSSGSGTITVTHPPAIPGYVSPHGMQSSSLPSIHSRSSVISEHTPVEPFSENPVHIQYPQHYSSPVTVQTHHHSAPSTIFTHGRSLGSDEYLVGDPDLSTFTQSEPNLRSLPADEILAETRPSTQDVPSRDPGAVGSVPVPLEPAGKQNLQGKQGQKKDKTLIHQGKLTSNGIHLDPEEEGVFFMFPPFSVSTPTSIVVYRWKRRFRSPPLQEHEAIVSSVIEIATNSGQALKFNHSVQLFLCHSAPDLAGYEIVIKKLVDTKNNSWEDVDVTKDLQNESDVRNYPSLADVEDLNLPVAHADISECTTYAVVCRLRASPPFSITSFGGSFNHPDYPDVTVTIPENAVPNGTKFSVQLQVQELPSETEGQGLCYGPVLRINCSQVVNFVKPVTIYLPVSLRGEPTGIPNTSLRVRVFFRNCNSEDKEWTEITRDLRDPAHFDGKLVQFQVDRFSGYGFVVENENKETGDVAKGLSKRAETVPLRAVFFAFFRPLCRDVIVLICCPIHLRNEVFMELKEYLQGMPASEGNSRKSLIPRQDKAFVFASGGVRACEPEERKIYLEVDDEHQFRQELRVLVLDNDPVAEVEFHTASSQTESDGFFLCKLHLPIPAKDDSRQTVEKGVQVTSTNRLANEENCVKGQKRLNMTKGNIENGEVPDIVLERMSLELGKSWVALARRLNFGDAEIEGFTYNDGMYPEMQFKMLQKWKQRLGSEATYQVLFDALCDKLVKRNDLAELFCVSNNHAAESGACFISPAQGLNHPSSSSGTFVGSESSQGGVIYDALQQICKMEAWDAGKTDPLLNLKKIAYKRGFVISDNQGEGNCMFFAISEQLELIQGVKLSHKKLRKKVVRYLKENPTLPDGTELFRFVEGHPSWDAYLQRMKANGTWGDHVILHGAANCFDTCIHVISSHHHDVLINPQPEDVDRDRLVLGHLCELHYVSLIPRKSPEGLVVHGPDNTQQRDEVVNGPDNTQQRDEGDEGPPPKKGKIA